MASPGLSSVPIRTRLLPLSGARRYILVGWQPSPESLEGLTTPLDKLSYVTDARTLRLFVWKLHNAVSASIERSEKWYQQGDSVNTSRYWPNVYATVHRAQYHSGVVGASRLSKTLDVLDKALASSGGYLTGTGFSLADISFMPYLEALTAARCEDLIEARPHLDAWWQRCRARPHWQATVAMAAKYVPAKK